MSRMANRLNEASFLELKARIESVIDEFGRREDADGVRMAFFLAGHTREESPQWARLSEPGD